MSLRPEPVGEIPAETVRVARAACPKGTLITRLRDEFDALYEDEDFRSLYPARGQPGLTPWRLALVHEVVGETSNEIPAVQTLIETLGLTGRVFTIDAMHCQKNLRDRQGDRQ